MKKFLSIIGLCCLVAGHAFAQLSVSISPSATPDPLTSIKVSASLTGVLAGATDVRFNVWRDFNANGIVDAGEPLLASYDVQNNKVYEIGGGAQRQPALGFEPKHQRGSGRSRPGDF